MSPLRPDEHSGSRRVDVLREQAPELIAESTPFGDTFTVALTSMQRTTVIASLVVAGLEYADPSIVIETLRVISEPAADVLETEIRERKGRLWQAN